MGTSITPACWISSARSHVYPAAVTAGLMMYSFSARRLSYLMTARREQLTKEEAAIAATIETRVPMLASAHKLLDHFHWMVRTHDTAALTRWIADSENSLRPGFCKGVKADLVAAAAALTERWSNEPGKTQARSS